MKVDWTNFMFLILRSTSRSSYFFFFRDLLYSIHFQIIGLLSVDSPNEYPDPSQKNRTEIEKKQQHRENEEN